MVLPSNWSDYKSVTTLAEDVLELQLQFGGRLVRATSSGLPIAAGDTTCFSDKTNSPPARTRLSSSQSNWLARAFPRPAAPPPCPVQNARSRAPPRSSAPWPPQPPAHRHALLERHRPRVDQRQAPLAGLGIDVGDLELPGRRRRRRAPADHIQARHGKAVFRPDRPRVFKTRSLCPNSATTPAT